MGDRIPAEVFPPGDFIREELEERGWTQSDLAKIMGRPVPVVNLIISGKRAITPEIAQELAAAFGMSPQYYLNLEAAYRLSQSPVPSKAIRHRAYIYEIAPVKDMERRQWICPTHSIEELENELKRFFGRKSLDRPNDIRIAARATSNMGNELTPMQYVWCFRALQLATNIQTAEFDQSALKKGLANLRVLATYPEEARKIPRVLAGMGIRFLVVEPMPNSRIDGAALWCENNFPIIALSLRYDRIDSFWHTLCHELAHILYEDRQGRLDIDLIGEKGSGNTLREPVEDRADRTAADMLIPHDLLESFIARVKPYYSKERIIQFAHRVQVHPGIVVGQLQHRGEIGYSANREMLEKVRHVVIQEALTDGWGHMVAGY